MTAPGSYRAISPSLGGARFRLLILWPCSSRPQPEIITSRNGSEPSCSSAFTSVVYNHERMISKACTRTVIGNGPLDRPEVPTRFWLIWGVRDEVIHVSITSGSPRNVPPHEAHDATGGASSS